MPDWSDERVAKSRRRSGLRVAGDIAGCARIMRPAEKSANTIDRHLFEWVVPLCLQHLAGLAVRYPLCLAYRYFLFDRAKLIAGKIPSVQYECHIVFFGEHNLVETK